MELAKLSGEERYRLVLSKAKEEGEVVLYTSMGVDSVRPLAEGFEKRYPGLKVKVWRGTGESVVNRVLTEGSAQKFYVDVISAGGNYFPPIERAKLVGRYESPERASYPEVHKDRHGYWTSYSYTLAIMAYNTTLVSGSDAPKRYEDFLRAGWKGNFAIDADPDRAVMGLLKSWGEKRTEEFLEGLIRNGVVIRRGHTLIAQLLCAGEFKAAIELLDYRVAEFKHKGCPIEMVFPDPTTGALTLLYAARHSPHPYAATLLVDYMLSDTGQRILAERGRYTGRPGMRVKYPEMDISDKKVNLLFLRPEDEETLGKKYLLLRERFLLAR